MGLSAKKDDITDSVIEILSSGRIRRRRSCGLAAIELGLYVLTCYAITSAWSGLAGPPTLFGLAVALGLFVINLLSGLYQRAVYVVHLRRLLRSALAHAISLLVMGLVVLLFTEQKNGGFFVLGMVSLSYVVTNALRPVLVEVLRAGNEDEQRRQPASTIT